MRNGIAESLSTSGKKEPTATKAINKNSPDQFVSKPTKTAKIDSAIPKIIPTVKCVLKLAIKISTKEFKKNLSFLCYHEKEQFPNSS